MNKLIFTITILFTSICTFAQSGYIFLPTENQYWNEGTNYTWIKGGDFLASPVKITWYWEEQMITVKDLKYAIFKEDVYFILSSEETKKDQTAIETKDGSIIIIDVAREQNLIVVTIMSPDKANPFNENGDIVIHHGRRFLIPHDNDHVAYIY